MKKLFFLIALLIWIDSLPAQYQNVTMSPFIKCGTDVSQLSSSYEFPLFPCDNDTLRVLVVFCNFPANGGGNFDWQNSVILQYWPGTQAEVKPSWADSLICPTTSNIWNRSITHTFLETSINKFYVIGDVYERLYVFKHDVDYYRYDLYQRGLGYAVKECLDSIDSFVDFSQYDKFDIYDIDDDGDKREPDGIVDFIFIVMRFTNAETIDDYSYTGIAGLGGWNQRFGVGVTEIVKDGTTIKAGCWQSGCIAEMASPWSMKSVVHEFVHYLQSDPDNMFLGYYNLTSGNTANAHDREMLGWNSTQPVNITGDTTFTLSDFTTTNDYAKIKRTSDTIYLENRRRITYNTSENHIIWKWLTQEKVKPWQSDSGLFIYKHNGINANNNRYTPFSAYGKWNWKNCYTGYYYQNRFTSPTTNLFIKNNSNRYDGVSTFNLSETDALDENCNTITFLGNNIAEVIYSGFNGDNNSCFDVGYNDVFSPWSNPPVPVTNSNDSVTIELLSRESNGDLTIKVYKQNVLNGKPSKPQNLIVSKEYFNPAIEYVFRPRLDWDANIEPDLYGYKIYRGFIQTTGVDPAYYYIATTQNNYFVDQDVVLYDAQFGSQQCLYEYVEYAYRITAIDNTDKESCKSDRDTIYGYQDPCAPEYSPNSPVSAYQYSLEQNYPNPFNPETKIKYSLKESGFVSIKIYDILGREVVTLCNEMKEKGNFMISFNSVNYNLASGIYFYRIEVANGRNVNFIAVKKMLLIK